jgi:hypothetical protein
VVVFGLLAGAVVLAPLPAGAVIGTFSDDDGNIHESAIEAVAAEGITRGCNPPANDRFCPEDNVTRGQMAAFLVRALGLTDSGSVTFDDDDDSEFEADIEKLAEAGITKGCSATRFCPEEPVTRGQMAAFLHRALEDGFAPGTPKAFTDIGGSVFADDIAWLSATGITRGCDDDKYCPDDPITRDQMATFLMRGLGLDPVPLFETGLPGPEDVALVSRFSVYSDSDTPNHVFQMAYWPRSFSSGFDIDPADGSEDWQIDEVDDPGAYRGWDILSPPTHWGFDDNPRDDDWLQFTLTRPARVAVVWQDGGSLPSWLKSGWSEGSGVNVDGTNARVFLREYPAGVVELGTVEGSSGVYRTMYTVLLAEADGTPTATPPIPAGRTYPVPGEPCPSWVHDLYKVEGPDGNMYNSWHPQMDSWYWCSFGHEHGSNPALIPGAPKVPYEYLSTKHGKAEPSAGFKEFIFKDLSGDYWVRMVVHAGTNGQGRVCAQFHTVVNQVYDLDGNQLMDVSLMADFGRAVNADTGAALSPTNCSASLPSLDTDRVRMINMPGDDHHYEQWDAFDDSESTANLGFSQFQLGVDMRNPMTECSSDTCNAVQRIERFDMGGVFDNGAERTIEVGRWDGGMDINPSGALATGEFWTDPMAMREVSSGAANAVRQFIDNQAALVDLQKDGDDYSVICNTLDPWSMYYTCRSIGDGDEFPHVPDMQIMASLREN